MAQLQLHLPSFFCDSIKETSNQEVYLSKQSVTEYDLSCSDIRNVAVTSPILAGLRNHYFCIPSTMNNLMNNQDPKFSAPPKDYTNIETILDPKLRTQDHKHAQTPVGTSTGLFHNSRYGKVIIPN